MKKKFVVVKDKITINQYIKTCMPKLTSNINMAIHNQLILHPGGADGDPIIPAAGIYVGRAVDVQMVAAGDERPDFPPDPAANPDVDHHRSGDLVLVEGDAQVRSHRHGGAVQERRPNGGVLVALVGGRQQRWEGDLLAVVGSVDVDSVVVDSDPLVGVAGGEGDLDGGGEGAGGGEVEGEDGGVLEDEMGLGGLEDEPDEEDEEEDEDDEAEAGGQEAPVELLAFVVVVAALLG